MRWGCRNTEPDPRSAGWRHDTTSCCWTDVWAGQRPAGDTDGQTETVWTQTTVQVQTPDVQVAQCVGGLSWSSEIVSLILESVKCQRQDLSRVKLGFEVLRLWVQLKKVTAERNKERQSHPVAQADKGLFWTSWGCRFHPYNTHWVVDLNPGCFRWLLNLMSKTKSEILSERELHHQLISSGR